MDSGIRLGPHEGHATSITEGTWGHVLGAPPRFPRTSLSTDGPQGIPKGLEALVGSRKGSVSGEENDAKKNRPRKLL